MENFQIYKLGFEEAEESEIKLPTFAGELEKHLLLLYWYDKPFDCVDHNKLWKNFKRWEYQTTWPASWEICMQVKRQQLELDME